LLGPFAIAQSGNDIRPFTSAELVTGANMALRRAVYDMERYDPKLGRVGESLIGCDDTDVVARIKSAGASGVWVGTARVRHYIPSERLTTDYIRRWFRGAGVTLARLNNRQLGPRLFGWPRWAIRAYCESIPGALLFAVSQGNFGFRSFKRMEEMGGLLAESRRLSSSA
jgi:hypothetical protein